MSSTKSTCPTCGKKANTLGIVCKCGNKYCMAHRMPEDHSCTFDHKSDLQAKLLTRLTSSTAPKIIEAL